MGKTRSLDETAGAVARTRGVLSDIDSLDLAVEDAVSKVLYRI